MNKEFIEKQLKLSKRQNKDERYDYLCSDFNGINYCVNLEKYTNKLQQENQKYKDVIDKIRKEINKEYSIMGVEVVENWVLKDILKEVSE